MKTMRLLSLALLALLVFSAGYPPAAQASPPLLPSSPDALSITSVTQSSDNLRLLTIFGTDFIDTPTVSLDGTLLEDVVFVSDTTLTATVPDSLPSGVYDLTVANPDLTEATLYDQQFYFDPPPTITNVEQPSLISNQITITGSGFIDEPEVFLGTTALNVTFIDAGELSAIVPDSVGTGTYTLKVVNPDGQFAQTTFSYWQPAPAPVIDRITQLPASLRTITIFGQNFSQDPIPEVYLGDTKIENVQTMIDPDDGSVSLRASVPPEIPSGTYLVRVVNPDGQEATLSKPFNFDQPPPTISSVTQENPDNLRQITIRGINIFYPTTVALNDMPILFSAVEYIDSNTLRATVPSTTAFPSGSYTVKVTNPDGQFATFTVQLFFEPAPKVTEVTQSSTNLRLLTITGENFVQTPAVYLGSTQLLSVVWQNSTALTAVVPDSVKNGSYTLRVVNPDSQEGTKSVALLFAPTPQITEVAQSQSNSRLLNITGSGFVATPTVYLGETKLLSVLWKSATALTAMVPDSVKNGTYTLRVVNPDGQEASLQRTFTFSPEDTGWKLFLPMAVNE